MDDDEQLSQPLKPPASTSNIQGGYENSDEQSPLISTEQKESWKQNSRFKLPGKTSVSWEGINVHLNTNTGTRQILTNIRGRVKSGEMLAVLGPSGSGKTTLLGILSGRSGRVAGFSTMEIEGEVSINGSPYNVQTQWRYLYDSCAYVAQHDLMLPFMTAKECVEFSALCRLPKSLTEAQKLEEAQKFSKEFDLVKCADTRIGNEDHRGVSGGEKKRVSIAVEMVIDPNIIILDEPTTGLDSVIAHHCMKLLKGMASRGKTVICTIHQPSSEIFSLFDRVMFMVNGHICFLGTRTKFAGYIESLDENISIPEYTNIADYALFHTTQDPNFFIDKWQSKYKSIQTPRSSVMDVNNDDYGTKNPQPEGLTISDQFKLLMMRELREQSRNPNVRYVLYSIVGFLAFTVGALWWDLADDCESNFGGSDYECSQWDDRAGYIFMTIMMCATVALGIDSSQYPEQRAIFEKERGSGWYYTVPYLICHTVIGLPIVSILILEWLLISYWMVGIEANFGTCYLIVWLSGFTASALGFVIACFADDLQSATLAQNAVLAPLMMFCGYLIAIDDIVDWLAWIHWLTLYYFAFAAMCVAEFYDRNYDVDDFSGGRDTIKGDKYLTDRFDFEDDDDFIALQELYIFMILFWGIVYRILGSGILIWRNGW